MPDELTEVLIGMKEKDRDTQRQLGELDKVTGVLVSKEGTIKTFVKRYTIKTKSITGNNLIWDNVGFGIWDSYDWAGSVGVWGNTEIGVYGDFEWGASITTSFLLGNSLAAVLGTSKLGEIPSYWITWYDSGDLEV